MTTLFDGLDCLQRQASEVLVNGCADGMTVTLSHTGASEDHKIEGAEVVLMRAKRLADDALETVAIDCATHVTLRERKAQAGMSQPITTGKDDADVILGTDIVREDGFKVATRSQA